MRTISYSTALDLLLSLPDFERRLDRSELPDRGLTNTLTLMSRLGNPHTLVPAIHVAGTKGKGSTATMIASVLKAEGYQVGLFTSPHLHSFRERIQLNGKPVSEKEFAQLVEMVWPHRVEISNQREWAPPMRSVFEMLTGMAFLYFAQKNVDFAVLEVGLGGTLDATNICKPVVTVITSLSLDHTEILGNTLTMIAEQKTGIAKSQVPLVVGPQAPEALKVVRRVAKEKGVPLVDVSASYHWALVRESPKKQSFEVVGLQDKYDLHMSLVGTHQRENAATAVASLETLRSLGYPLSNASLRRGFHQVRLPGRLEVLQSRPLVVADGAHNPYSIRCLSSALPTIFPYNGVVLVIGCGRGHDIVGMIRELKDLPLEAIIATCSRHPSARSAPELSEAFSGFGVPLREIAGVDVALREALQRASHENLILVTGSLFVAAEAREFFLGIPRETYSWTSFPVN